MILSQLIHYTDTNSVEATWVDDAGVPVRCHSYADVQMDDLVADLGADAAAHAGLIAQVRAAIVPVPPRPPEVPSPITPRQLRMALTRTGLRSAVEAAVAAGSQDLKDWYEFSTAFERGHEQVEAMRVGLGKTNAEVDAVWQLGATL